MTSVNPVFLASVAATLVIFGFLYFFTQDRTEQRARSDIKKRLDLGVQTKISSDSAEPKKPKSTTTASKVAKKANDFYATNDPKSIRKMQMQLIQAGYLQQNALGYFIAIRIGLGVGCGLIGLILAFFIWPDMTTTNKLLTVLVMASMGYFLPNKHVSSRVKKYQTENRLGFPDVMDLMIVAAEAGLTMEASIDRISLEVEKTYPMLSRQLAIASIEIRAGRPLDQALRAFGERLGLEEVQGFATMIQQSKELGTSISDALRVYSDEMRHKRMMAAEEKAYALPAKLSIPVTAFILPVVIGVAVLPTAVRMMHQ
ncbi:MAG: type II secretion system F family protein [Rhizobiaceae bacterium]